MKRITTREMKWINKGDIRKLSYNKFEAKGNNSLFYAVSDENFNISFSHAIVAKDYSFIISISENTFYSLNFSAPFSITTSINGFKSNSIINNNYSSNINSLNIKIVRDYNTFTFYIENEIISSATLPGSKDAVTFGFLFNNKEFVYIKDFLYSKK